jgi:peptidoglycan/xylan/chitin deacetylase (PgdA/CDA1 family)
MKARAGLILAIAACGFGLAVGCAGAPERAVPEVAVPVEPVVAQVATMTTPTASPKPAPVAAVATAPVRPRLDTSRYMGKPVKRSRAQTTAVAITLDDGPSSNLGLVLSILREHDARVTFFFVGNRTPRFRRRMPDVIALGCEVGNHTWDHEEVEGESRARILDSVDRAQAELTTDTGVAPVLMRPPAGHWDERALEAVNSRGLVMALWSLHGQDTGEGTHSEKIARDVIRSARGGDVILLHETNIETVNALPAIIDGLRKKGLHLVTMSELLAAP